MPKDDQISIILSTIYSGISNDFMKNSQKNLKTSIAFFFGLCYTEFTLKNAVKTQENRKKSQKYAL